MQAVVDGAVNSGPRNGTAPKLHTWKHAGLRILPMLAFASLAFAGSAAAQVSSADQLCITTFNKSLRKVVKEQGKIVKRCLRDFASGKLVTMTAELCIRSDPDGKVERAAEKAVDLVNSRCAGGIPGFGATPINGALLEAVLSQVDLMHGSIGVNLDLALIATPQDAGCQAQTAAALIKCQDARIREFLKCQKTGLRAGTITNAASLASECLGTGAQGQPDGNGLISYKCETKVGGVIGQQCGTTSLSQAFIPCNAANANDLTDCINAESACQTCLLLNEVDNLSRDCDLFDDGNASNGSCGAECGDGVLQGGESCDDGDFSDLDGCSSDCTVEGGWTCTGEPSVCTQNCGDGDLDVGETCDDGDAAGGDGCSSTCFVENGYGCTGQPSVCTLNCGNGSVQAGEACDDGDAASGDGCSSTCQVEPGYNCTGSPSNCTFVCGNGTFQSGETCDDNDAIGGDGCSAICQIEAGWLCSGQPSLCAPLCGDGLIRGTEGCDDNDAFSGDGCSTACQPEPGYSCAGQPSNCLAVCGDGLIRGFETCDDSNLLSLDGCSAPFCLQESSHACAGQPSICFANCGDGNLDVPEECDDGDAMSGDGCHNCLVEAGYACGGTPSLCALTCGNGMLDANEQCDDGNLVNNDGCSAGCQNQNGWFCQTPGSPCNIYDVFIDSPAHGIFTLAGSILVTGHYTTLPAGTVGVTVNGVAASSLNQTLRTFSHTVPLSQALIFNPIRVVLTNTTNGDQISDRVVVIAGESVLDGAYSPQSVAMRINDTGLNSIEPLVADLAAGSLNLGALLPPGTTILPDQCFISVIGCWGSASVTIANPPPTYSHLTLAMDSIPGAVFGDIDIFNLRIDVNINGSGLVPNCGLRLTASSLQLTGNYALQPLPGDPTNVDVNLVTNPPGVQFSGFNHQFTSGICDDFIIGDIIQAFLPNIQDATTNGIRDFLKDPDGAGSADSPIADAIEGVLAGISISGPVGAGLGLMLDTPLFTVAEDNTGITFGSDSKFEVSVGAGPGQCQPPVGAPNFSRSYSKSEVFPTFGPNTPVGNNPYGLGICISTAGFNQLLRGQTECGLLRTSLTTIDLDGSGPGPSLPITSSLLSLLVPEFSQLPPATPLRIDVAPTLAPVVSGNNGPAGELTELKVAHIDIDIVQPGPETVWLSGALDTRMGMNLAFLPDGTGLAITVNQPALADISLTVLHNPLGTNENQVETVLPAVIRPLIPSLAGALSGFPLPQFFGLSIQGVEVSRNGQFMSLFANLVPAP